MDVTVLRLCALKFRKDFIELTEIDPFESVTIASACQRYYRTFHLEKKKIAVISGHGYQVKINYQLHIMEKLIFLLIRRRTEKPVLRPLNGSSG